MSEHLEITGIAYPGRGVARVDGKVYFIDDTVPGDTVEADIATDKKNFAEGKVKTMVSKSPLRGDAPCPYFGDCGGCFWQDIAYDKQIEWKAGFIEESLKRIGGVSMAAPVEVLLCSEPYGYRSRIQLRCTVDEDGSLRVGFFRKGLHKQVAISKCLLAREAINGLIANLDGLKTRSAPQKLRIEIQEFPNASQSKEPALYVTLTPADRGGNLTALADQVQAMPNVRWSGLSSDLKEQVTALFETHEGIRYYASPGQFHQVNHLHNHALRGIIGEIVDKFAPETLVDIYCGSGNLSLGQTAPGRRIDGIEFSKSSIRTAKYNVSQNGLHNIQFHRGDGSKELKRYLNRQGTPDMVIVDPPRKGMAELVKTLRASKPKTVVYVSCDPTTMARDIRALKGEYRVDTVTGLDFFPQTYHVESVCTLVRL